MAIFNSFFYVYQRVSPHVFPFFLDMFLQRPVLTSQTTTAKSLLGDFLGEPPHMRDANIMPPVEKQKIDFCEIRNQQRFRNGIISYVIIYIVYVYIIYHMRLGTKVKMVLVLWELCDSARVNGLPSRRPAAFRWIHRSLWGRAPRKRADFPKFSWHFEITEMSSD